MTAGCQIKLALIVILGVCLRAGGAGAQGPPQGPFWTSATGPGGPQPAGPNAAAAPSLALKDGQVFEVVPLKYADVSEIVGLLTSNQTVHPNDNFAPQEPAFGSAAFQGYAGGSYGAGLGPPSANPGFNPQIPASDSVGRAVDDSVGIDRRLNAIVLEGTPDHIARLKAQIAKLDVPVSSVVLETVFVELSQSGARSVGLDFNNPNGQLATAAYSLVRGDFPGLPNTVTLQIAPRVSDDGFVTSHVFAVVSSVTGFSQGYPTISQRVGAIVSHPA